MPQLNALYEWIKDYTNAKGIYIPLREINIIISSITGIPKEHFLAHRDIVLSNTDNVKIKQAVKKRGTHYPLQYIIGSVEFMGISFLITPGVLIPRPETELLVETVLKYVDDRKYRTILDLCCGSGIIGLSVARMNKSIFVSLSDKSRRAIRLAKRNSRRLGLTSRVKFYTGDLFSPLHLPAKFDLIVSNPPYVPHNRIRHLQKEVLYEPLSAIDGGRKGMQVIKEIMKHVRKYLNKGGMLIIEHDDTQGKYFKGICADTEQAGLEYVKTIADLSGLPRISIFAA